MIISILHDLTHLSVLADISSNIFFLLDVRFGEKSAGDPGSADWSETSEVSTTLYQHKCTPLILTQDGEYRDCCQGTIQLA